MVKQDEKHNMIVHCLQCPIGKKVISDYILSFYPQWKRNKIKLDRHVIDVIKEIAVPLNLKFDFEQASAKPQEKRMKKIEKEYYKAIDILIRLSTDKKIKYSNFPYRRDCVTTIKWILRSIIDINEETESRQIQNTDSYYVIHMMNKIVRPDCAEQTETKYLKHAYKDDEINLYSIIIEYCSNTIQYKYCNAEFKEFEKYGKLRDCRSAMFQILVGMQDHQATLDIKCLNSHSIQILHEYIMSVPKSFGYNLSTIMHIQGVTHEDLAKVFEVKSSAIQSLCMCDRPKPAQVDIKKLAQVLLVSEGILFYGTGELYGIWDEILSEYTMHNLKKMPQDKSAVARAEKQEILSKVAKMESDDFMQMVNDESEFFYKRPYCVYLEKYEEEYYYDYSEMVSQALHPEEIEILVSTLRKCQSDKVE